MKKYGHVVFILILILVLAFSGCGGGSHRGGGGTNNGGGATVINIAAIPGVAVPVRGEAPVTTAIDTAQYTGSITWSPADDYFKPQTVYTANIVLTAKTGYTLSGVAENFFTVAGATATNAAGSGNVTAVFAVTAAENDAEVAFISAAQTGGTSGTANSTGLTLTFSADPTTLTADNITVTGATKGALSGSGTTRTLAISNITVLNGETVSVTITSPAGYSISGSPQTAVVYRTPINVTFQSATQIGGASGTADSTGLTLTFSADPTTLTADNITVIGATKGALSGSGTTRTLAISNITVANGGTVSITITSPAGYVITGSPQTVVVYRLLTIGMDYLGGKIAYILQPGDPGYDANVPHGLIAAAADQSTGICWAVAAYQSTSVPGGTDTALGTGSANTDHIIAQNGAGSTYAAGLARAYNGGGYSDWYLPSMDELNKLYVNKVAIGGFVGYIYWSSSEYNANYAWFQDFGNGSQNGNGKDASYISIRVVRAF